MPSNDYRMGYTAVKIEIISFMEEHWFIESNVMFALFFMDSNDWKNKPPVTQLHPLFPDKSFMWSGKSYRGTLDLSGSDVVDLLKPPKLQISPPSLRCG